jgi:acyl-coenzyme A synthetase/AMP-(fatty) acid ligase
LSEIVLNVVATSGADGEAALAAAREQLARKLPAFKLPRQYALAAGLPRTATGKVQRPQVARRAADREIEALPPFFSTLWEAHPPHREPRLAA